ncbi:hypothetical protein [Thiosulfativibrio zosterae]|uniref:Uncharacterized protein n=1 Tax=Thiosulfativibrio zosterae TaxID=2675053 RepID=A0A6F8PPV2_9GAMM|nr:hypothetical protein [Thiosulfativibrio zosterae]BBP44143.1 hypothetical protein THMIRHAT_18890 [Thiosulfativibrio zosterae]
MKTLKPVLSSSISLRGDDAIKLVEMVLDANNMIIEVSDSWDASAKAGNADSRLSASAVIGQSIDHFISGDSSVMYLDSALKLCRLKKQTLFKPYRCDSPTHKRFMEMELQPLANGQVKISHYLIREEAFGSPLYLKDVTRTSSAKEVVVRCSMCNQLKKPGTDTWLPPEEFQASQDAPLNVIHSVCPACQVAIWEFRVGRPESSD